MGETIGNCVACPRKAHVLLPSDSSTGLSVPSVAVFNQIRAINRARLRKKLGAAGASVMLQADQAIKAVFGLS